LNSITRTGARQNVYMAPRIETHYTGSSSYHTGDTLPLYSRAWIFQERMLSRRILHFTDNEITWDCCTVSWCEGAGGGQFSFRDRGIWTVLDSGGNFGRGYNGRLLRALCELFSSFQLTYATDKLPALLGLARLFKDNGMNCYISGIWMDDFPHNLSWRPSESVDVPFGTRITGIPTWSWASFPGVVEWSKATTVDLSAVWKSSGMECSLRRAFH
jgi:hypothetical protein